MKRIVVDVYEDYMDEDGNIVSGKLGDTFEVERIEDIQSALEARYGTSFEACADGKDGMFENSAHYGVDSYFLVSNIRGAK